MIVISRQKDESIIIGDDIIVTVVEIRDDKVRLGIDHPREVPVHRLEVYEAIRREEEASTTSPVAPISTVRTPLLAIHCLGSSLAPSDRKVCLTAITGTSQLARR